MSASSLRPAASSGSSSPTRARPGRRGEAGLSGPAPAQATRTQGPDTAVVVGPPGTEIHTDKYGRVKVHFHWDRYGQKDGTDSCWIRVAHPWAGSNFGAIHIPRVGQEVIVDFEHGDPDRPIITGRVYNAAQMPPWGLPVLDDPDQALRFARVMLRRAPIEEDRVLFPFYETAARVLLRLAPGDPFRTLEAKRMLEQICRYGLVDKEFVSDPEVLAALKEMLT